MSEVWILAIFKKFQAIYLHKWTSAIEGIEETAMVEWSQALGGLTGDQVKNGLSNLTDEWPPTAISFRTLCEGKGINGFGLDYVPEYHRKPITNPERILSSDARKAHRKEIATEGVKNLKAALKK